LLYSHLFAFILHCLVVCGFFFFFFQAEDGIRDFHVTGVQTCALPIYPWVAHFVDGVMTDTIWTPRYANAPSVAVYLDNGELLLRSEERRVGKECRSRGSREHEKKK